MRHRLNVLLFTIVVLPAPMVFLPSCSTDQRGAGSAGSSAASAPVGTTAPARDLTLFEISEVVAIDDSSPVVFTPPPPRKLDQTPGPGDTLVLESTLYSQGTTRTANTATEPPAVIPGATIPTGDYETFDAKDKAGDLQGTCTFVRVIDRRPEFQDRTMTCHVTLLLEGGALTYGGLMDVDQLENAAPVTLPIVGGTGEYAGACGTVQIQQPSVQAFDRFRLDVHLMP